MKSEELMHLPDPDPRIRLVHENDCRLLWEWANDPVVRASSFSSEPISFERHTQWFADKFNNPNCILYIALSEDGTPIGQVRYDVTDHEAVISISVDQKFRGRGIGTRMIRMASQKVLTSSPIKVIHAYVKESNLTSAQAFQKAGFSRTETITMKGHRAIHLVLSKQVL